MKVTYSAKANITHRTQQLQDGKSVEVISLTQAEHAQDAQLVLEWNFPILDIAGRWHPNCRFDRSIKADWSYGEKSMSAVSAPVISFFNEEGQNRGTFALSETLKEVRMSLGVHEEDGTMNCMVVVSLGTLDSDYYELSLLCDDRNVRYEQAIREVGIWWETDCGLHPASVPESAREPMYSFWYSYHQQFTDEEIEAECKRAKELGFGTVIVDDGWQTDDTNRGYGFCGDWKPAAGKIKDMRKHVEKVHQMGLKYLLWLSVPYVGIHSEMWKHFHDKLIGMDWQQNTGILDIRYPEVREYLSKVYADAVKDWDLDGLKLDFIDEFYQRKETPAVNEQMDCACIQQALDKLLAETMERLKKRKTGHPYRVQTALYWTEHPQIWKYLPRMRLSGFRNQQSCRNRGFAFAQWKYSSSFGHADVEQGRKSRNCSFAGYRLSVWYHAVFGSLRQHEGRT